MTQEEIGAIYQQLLPPETSFSDADKIISGSKIDEIDEIRVLFCDELISAISVWPEEENIAIYCKHAKLLAKKENYFKAIDAFYEKRHADCMAFVRKAMEQCFDRLGGKTTEALITEQTVAVWYLVPMKQAFPGFWKELAACISQYAHEPGTVELCEMLQAFYDCKTNEEAVEILSDFVRCFPDFVTPKELLGCTYYDMARWSNALACFEAVEETALFLVSDLLYFQMAYAYGKIKNIKLEEQYYRAALERAPDVGMTLNNLAYCLYAQKRLEEAKSLLERCLELEPDFGYANNNYVRVLLAMGRNKDAKAFLKTSKKVSAALRRKVEAAEDKNESRKTVELPAEEADAVQNRRTNIESKKQQFSNEKLLEDELTARIESGTEVFGMQLKMYRRKGVYGRQFIIPVGRLDLLCEDEKGDLYVIELKKDAGYDDAYAQTAMYLDWFEQTNFAEGKKVYGIICLNSPTKELLDKVHGDKRMRVFEYRISYTER